MTDKILAAIENGVGWLTFNNPEKRNAFSIEMSLVAADVIASFDADGCMGRNAATASYTFDSQVTISIHWDWTTLAVRLGDPVAQRWSIAGHGQPGAERDIPGPRGRRRAPAAARRFFASLRRGR